MASVRIPIALWPRDARDWAASIAGGLLWVFALVFVPAFALIVAARLLGFVDIGTGPLLLLFYWGIALVLMTASVRRITCEDQGLRFVRLTGHPRLLRWEEILEVTPASRSEVLRGALSPHWPPNSATWSMTSLGQVRIVYPGGVAYFPPRDVSAFLAHMRSQGVPVREHGATFEPAPPSPLRRVLVGVWVAVVVLLAVIATSDRLRWLIDPSCYVTHWADVQGDEVQALFAEARARQVPGLSLVPAEGFVIVDRELWLPWRRTRSPYSTAVLWTDPRTTEPGHHRAWFFSGGAGSRLLCDDESFFVRGRAVYIQSGIDPSGHVCPVQDGFRLLRVDAHGTTMMKTEELDAALADLGWPGSPGAR